MDNSGVAFPSQRTIAAGARVTENTVQVKLKSAIESGWLLTYAAGHSGKGWKRYGYRACVPNSINLAKFDEWLSGWSDVHGGPPASSKSSPAVVPIVEGDEAVPRDVSRDSSPSSRPDVPILTPLRPLPDVASSPSTMGLSLHLSSQLRNQTEGALARTGLVKSVLQETKNRSPMESIPKEQRILKARELLRATPTIGRDALAKCYQLDAGDIDALVQQQEPNPPEENPIPERSNSVKYRSAEEIEADERRRGDWGSHAQQSAI
jgi:hypothetical protein